NFPLISVSYATLESALAMHDSTGDATARAAAAALPTSDPSSGGNWLLPVAYARMLGLTTSTPQFDDTVTLNTSYNWTYGQDVIATIEHEITEGGMGRIGGLGDEVTSTGAGYWSVMDLFRFNSAGVRDYTDGRDGQATYFSVNGSQLLLSFNNRFGDNP